MLDGAWVSYADHGLPLAPLAPGQGGHDTAHLVPQALGLGPELTAHTVALGPYHTHTHTHAHAHTHAYTQTSKHTNTCTHTRAHARTHAHTHTHTPHTLHLIRAIILWHIIIWNQ